MVRIMERSGGAVLGLECRGRPTCEEFEAVAPALEAALAEHGEARLLLFVDAAKGYGVQRLVAAARFALPHWERVARLAVVGARGWWLPAAQVEDLLSPWQERFFDTSGLDEAWDWLAAD